jgi:hypothetical protein
MSAPRSQDRNLLLDFNLDLRFSSAPALQCGDGTLGRDDDAYGRAAASDKHEDGKEQRRLQVGRQENGAGVVPAPPEADAHVGTFNSTPEAAAAIASAELLGPENLPTPAARKPRTKKSGAHFAAWRSPCRLMTESVCVWSTSRARHRVPAEDGAARPRAV